MYTEAQQRKARMEERTRRVEVVTRQNTIDSTANNPTSVDKPEQQYSVEVRTEPVRTAEVPYWLVFLIHVMNKANCVENLFHDISSAFPQVLLRLLITFQLVSPLFNTRGKAVENDVLQMHRTS